jgi:hypothetical protein
MSFAWYEVRYQAMSPLHLGYHKLGMVQRTRAYIPGRALWGAVTNNLSREVAGSGAPDYRGVGKLVHRGLRFIYFYPWLDADSGALVPWIAPDAAGFSELGYGVKKAKMESVLYAQEFERLFLYASGQTAVSPYSQTAQDSTLHETEYLAHQVSYPESRPVRPVYFFGYLGIGPDFPYADQLWPAIRNLVVGGERSYGCGRLRLIQSRELSTEDSFFGWGAGTLLPGGQEVSWYPGFPFPAHVRASTALPMGGDLEPLVGRVTKDSQTFGQNVTDNSLCWTPGSTLSQARTFTIGDYGIWTLKE